MPAASSSHAAAPPAPRALTSKITPQPVRTVCHDVLGATWAAGRSMASMTSDTTTPPAAHTIAAQDSTLTTEDIAFHYARFRHAWKPFALSGGRTGGSPCLAGQRMLGQPDVLFLVAKCLVQAPSGMVGRAGLQREAGQATADRPFLGDGHQRAADAAPFHPGPHDQPADVTLTLAGKADAFAHGHETDEVVVGLGDEYGMTSNPERIDRAAHRDLHRAQRPGRVPPGGCPLDEPRR